MATELSINEIVKLSKDDRKFEEKCLELVSCVNAEKYTITQLVQDLGPFLTSTTVSEREKATLILSNTLLLIPEDILNSAQLTLISNFYTERLNDHHQVVPAVIKGLTPLITSTNLPDGLSTKLVNALFQYVPCQQQQQPDRFNIYNFIKTLLEKREEEMKAMGLEFVYGVISAIDSERDPRNLLFLFNWLPTFLKKINLGQLTEEMFDVMSCYFPVDFRPLTQDENEITRETLANALCPCLCHLSSFAELCIPLALEKLESDLRIAKLDSLDLLIEGCNTFPLEIYKKYCSASWSLIQKEVLSNNYREENNLEEKCLKALSSILRKVSEDVEFTKQVGKDIIDTLRGNLKPEAVLFLPSWKLIKSVSQSCQLNAIYTFKEISSMLINLYYITNAPTGKVVILQQLVELALPCFNSDIDEMEDLKLIPTICLKALGDAEPHLRLVGVSSFSILAPYVDSTMCNCFYQKLSSLIITEEEPTVRNEILACLRTYASLYSEEIEKLLKEIPSNGLESLQVYLEAVGAVALTKLMPFSLSILTEHLTHKTYNVSSIAAKVLRIKLEQHEIIISRHLIEVEGVIDKIIEYLLQNNFDIEQHSKFLDDITQILTVVIRHIKEKKEEMSLIEKIEKVKKSEGNDFKVVLLFGLLTSLRPTTKISINLQEIQGIALKSESSYICNIGSQLLAVVINKASDEDLLMRYLSDVEEECKMNLLANKNVENVIQIYAFVTKALAIKCHPMAFTWIEKLIDLSAKNFNAVKAFYIMFDEENNCLSTKNYCSKKLLYKQKFFNEISNYLISNYEEKDGHYLSILGYLLQNVPQPILKLELKKIIRLVLLCLNCCKETEVQLAVLTCINTIIKNKEQLAEDYIQEFLKYYLKLAQFEKSMRVRILALKGIQFYSDYPLYKLLPLKQNVLAVLSFCLDDKKRLVRKEAVEARSTWSLIDAPI